MNSHSSTGSTLTSVSWPKSQHNVEQAFRLLESRSHFRWPTPVVPTVALVVQKLGEVSEKIRASALGGVLPGTTGSPLASSMTGTAPL